MGDGGLLGRDQDWHQPLPKVAERHSDSSGYWEETHTTSLRGLEEGLSSMSPSGNHLRVWLLLSRHTLPPVRLYLPTDNKTKHRARAIRVKLNFTLTEHQAELPVLAAFSKWSLLLEYNELIKRIWPFFFFFFFAVTLSWRIIGHFPCLADKYDDKCQ